MFLCFAHVQGQRTGSLQISGAESIVESFGRGAEPEVAGRGAFLETVFCGGDLVGKGVSFSCPAHLFLVLCKV